MPGTTNPGLLRRVLDNPTFHESRLLSAPVNVGMDVAGKVLKNTVYLAGLAGSASNDPIARGLGNFLRDTVVSKELDRVTQETTKLILSHSDDPEFMTRVMAGEGVSRPDVPIPGLRQQAARQAIGDVRSAYSVAAAPDEIKALRQQNQLRSLRLRDYEAERTQETARLKLAERQMSATERSIQLRENELAYDKLIGAYKLDPSFQKAQVETAKAELALLKQQVTKGQTIISEDAEGRTNVIRLDESDPTGMTWRLVDLPNIPGFVPKKDPNRDVVTVEDPVTGATTLSYLDMKTGIVKPFTYSNGMPVTVKGPKTDQGPIAAGRALAGDWLGDRYGVQLAEVISKRQDELINKPSKTRSEADELRSIGLMQSFISGQAIGPDGKPVPPDPGMMLSYIRKYLGKEAHDEAYKNYQNIVLYADRGYIWDPDTERAYTIEGGARVPYGSPNVSDPTMSGAQKGFQDPLGALVDRAAPGAQSPQHQITNETRQMPQARVKKPGKLFEADEVDIRGQMENDLAILERLSVDGVEYLNEEDAAALYRNIQGYIKAGIRGPILDSLIRKLKAMDPNNNPGAVKKE